MAVCRTGRELVFTVGPGVVLCRVFMCHLIRAICIKRYGENWFGWVTVRGELWLLVGKSGIFGVDRCLCRAKLQKNPVFLNGVIGSWR